MNKANGFVERIKVGMVIGLLTSLMGCAGYWGGGYYGDAVVVAEPDVFLFSGDYDRGRDVHNYSHRGSESRSVAHSGGSHGGAHSGGGQGGKR